MPRLRSRILTGLALAALSNAGFAAQNYYFDCHNDAETRRIKVVYAKAGEAVPCTVHYIKGGSDQILWQAETQTGYCEDKAREFAELQRQEGWQCQRQSGNPKPSGS